MVTWLYQTYAQGLVIVAIKFSFEFIMNFFLTSDINNQQCTFRAVTIFHWSAMFDRLHALKTFIENLQDYR